MKVRLFAVLLLIAPGAFAATIGEVPSEISPLKPAVEGPAAALTRPDLQLPVPSLVPSAIPTAETSAIPQAQPENFGQRVRQLTVSIDKAGAQAQAPAAADGGSAAAGKQFDLLTRQTPAADEPSAEDAAAMKRQLILRNPTIPASVSRVIERETGLTAEHPFFENIAKKGSQPRNAHTNEPLGEAYKPVNPNSVIAGLFHLRQENRPYYDSLRNKETGVVATGVRGGVDTMIEDLLGKGFIQPRSAGRNYRFLNGVYMDLPHYIHEVRKYAQVDPYRTEGKDRYPMTIAFRAGNVHHPGSDYQGRIVGDGGTLGQVALDPVKPEDIVSIYVQRSRIKQTLERIKGTPLAHAQVLPSDILPGH
jgi:hypothetical protein